MDSKPKKTLTDEQKKKMAEGRKKAMDKRKKEREAAKAQAKELESAKKSKDKEKLLQLEMEALQQQQDRIDNLRLQVARKKQVKNKLQKIKQEEEIPDDQTYEVDIDDNLEMEIVEALETVEEEVEEKEDKQPVVSDAEYSAVFKREANKMRKNIPVEARQYYDKAVRKFDFTLSLDDNIKNMIDYVKHVVGENTDIVKNVRDKQIKEENKKEIVHKSVTEKITEQTIDSKIGKLMKMRY